MVDDRGASGRDGVSLGVTSLGGFGAAGVRCRFPPAPLVIPLVTAIEGDASVDFSAPLLRRRRAYSSRACSPTTLAIARLSASPRIAGLLQTRIAILGVNPCSTICPGRAGSKGREAVGARSRRRREHEQSR